MALAASEGFSTSPCGHSVKSLEHTHKKVIESPRANDPGSHMCHFCHALLASQIR
jgi:hypothetical protein